QNRPTPGKAPVRLLTTYEYQPEKNASPCGFGWSSTDTSAFRRSVSGPSVGFIIASAIRGHAASMIAAPGSSILPSPVKSGGWARRALQASRSFRSCASSGFGAAPAAATIAGTSKTPRRSCVAAVFIAPTTDASVWIRRFATLRCKRSTRCAGPNTQLLSDAEKPRPDLLFQLMITPLAGAIPWMCAASGSNPRQSSAPVPSVGSPDATPGARTGSRPLENNAMFLSSAYTQLNVNSSRFIDR